MAFETVDSYLWSQNYNGTKWNYTKKEVTVNTSQVVTIAEIQGTGIEAEDGTRKDGHFLLNLGSVFANQLEVSEEDASKIQSAS